MYPKEHILSGALGLLLKISRLFCVAPITITSNRIKYSRVYGILSGLIAITLNITVIVCFSAEFSNTGTTFSRKHFTSQWVRIANIGIIMFISLFGVLGAEGRLKCLINALNVIEKLSYKIGANTKHSERDQFMAIYICLVLNSTLVIISLYAEISQEGIQEVNVKTFVMIFIFYMGYTVRQLLLLQFTLAAVQIKDLLRDMNDKLQEIKDTLDDQDTFIFKSRKSEPKNINRIIDSMSLKYMKSGIEERFIEAYLETLRRLAGIYICICDIIEGLGTKHGPLLLLLLNSFFLYLVVTPYYEVFSNIYVLIEEPSMLSLRIAWFLFHLSNLIIFLEPCHQTLVEIQRTRFLISQLFRRLHPYDTLYEELNVFYRVLLLKTTAYSPYSLCVLERPLIVTIMGVVTTYLVIIFQFRNPNEDE